MGPWDRPPWRAIEMKIGEGLRKRCKPPEKLPPRMLKLLMQITEQTESRTRH